MKRQLKKADRVYVTITHEKDANLFFVDWDGYLSVEMVKTGSEELLNMIKEAGKCDSVLVDNRKVSGPWQAANEWYEKDWNPRAVKAGLKYMAVIMSDNVFTQLSLQGFAKVTKGVYTVGVFNSESQARTWLKEQQVATVSK